MHGPAFFDLPEGAGDKRVRRREQRWWPDIKSECPSRVKAGIYKVKSRRPRRRARGGPAVLRPVLHLLIQSRQTPSPSIRVKMTFGFVEDPYGIPELYFELCPRYGPLAHELSYFAYPAVCSSSSSAHESSTSALKKIVDPGRLSPTSALKKIVVDPGLMTANSSF